MVAITSVPEKLIQLAGYKANFRLSVLKLTGPPSLEKPMKYEVKIKAIAEVKTYIEIEAPNVHEALRIAKERIENGNICDERDLSTQNDMINFEDWEITYIYDQEPTSHTVRVTDISRADMGIDDLEWMQDEDGL